MSRSSGSCTHIMDNQKSRSRARRNRADHHANLSKEEAAPARQQILEEPRPAFALGLPREEDPQRAPTKPWNRRSPARQRRQRSQRPRPARVPTSSGRGKNADGRREWPICTRDLPCGVLRPGQNQRPGECCMRRPRARATGRCARDHTACSTCTVAWRVRHRRGRAVRPCKGVGLVGGWVAGEMRRPVRSV